MTGDRPHGFSPAPNSPPGPPSGDGRSQQDSDTVAYGGAVKPIYIGYDDRLLSATLNALDFKPLFSDRQSDAQAGVGSDFGVTTEARKIAFVLLMGVTAYRQLPKNGMIKLKARYQRDFYRRQYIHNNYTVSACDRFPSAASVIVPVRNMDLSGADAVLADTIRQNPAWAIEPDLRRPNEN